MKRISVGLAQEVERMIPEIIDVVQRTEAAPIVMRLEAFDGKPDLLYHCLWYATSYGKAVQVQAELE